MSRVTSSISHYPHHHLPREAWPSRSHRRRLSRCAEVILDPASLLLVTRREPCGIAPRPSPRNIGTISMREKFTPETFENPKRVRAA